MPDGDGYWIEGKLCFQGLLETAFDGDLGYTLLEAKTKCESACNDRDDCLYASLYFVEYENKQVCYLDGEKCTNWKAKFK